jgi:hypothetical protein
MRVWPPPIRNRSLRPIAVRARRSAGHIPSGDLIAPFDEFQSALRNASAEERRILRAGRRSPSPIDQISAAVAARLVLARRMSTLELKRYLQHLQGRYYAAVGATAYGRYQASVPKDVFDNPDKLWAEVETISYRLRLAYAISYLRDQYIDRIMKACFYGFLIGTLQFFALLAWEQFSSGPRLFLLNYVMIALAGWAGALTSIVRRASRVLSIGPLDEDPVIQANALHQGFWSTSFGALTGPVFALVLVVVLMCSAINIGDLAPHFVNCGPTCANPDFVVFGYRYNIGGPADGAKLLLFAFIAGFAERLVPDMLDRLSQSVDGKSRRPHCPPGVHPGVDGAAGHEAL